ncbi:Uncharacterised protein [Vibrio cholerae]|nr:Uncharacterised protein [Vibrio cholerae]
MACDQRIQFVITQTCLYRLNLKMRIEQTQRIGRRIDFRAANIRIMV